MLFPVAGTRFFIADSVQDPQDPPLPALDWVEVGETEAFGTLGGEYEMHEAHSFAQGYMAMKGVHTPQVMQLVLGLDPADPGQARLLQAYYSPDAYAFRMLFPDGETERRWFALVTRLGEVFDAANNVMRMQVDLHPVTAIQR